MLLYVITIKHSDKCFFVIESSDSSNTKVSPSIQAFYVSDLSFNTDSFTISKVLMKYINILFYNI